MRAAFALALRVGIDLRRTDHPALVQFLQLVAIGFDKFALGEEKVGDNIRSRARAFQDPGTANGAYTLLIIRTPDDSCVYLLALESRCCVDGVGLRYDLYIVGSQAAGIEQP